VRVFRSDAKLELKRHKRGANPKKILDSTVGRSDLLGRPVRNKTCL
jgi:hypothetical protein